MRGLIHIYNGDGKRALQDLLCSPAGCGMKVLF